VAYRNDVEALEARLADLRRDVADRTRERDEVARLIAEMHERDRRAAILADLQAGGPEQRLRRRALTTLGIVAMTVIGALGYRAYQRDDRMEKVMARFEEFADAVCACTDKACGDKVMAETSRWSTAIAKDLADPPKLDDAMTKRATQIGEKFGRCAAKLTTP